MAIHTKRGGTEALAYEHAGLVALAQAALHGGAPVARVASSGRGCLATFLLDHVTPTPAAARSFGARLARTHAHATGPRVFGEAPPGFGEIGETGIVGAMGTAPLPLVAPGSPSRHFGEFYASDRLLPYVAAARSNGSLSASDAAAIDRLAERLRAGVFDAPQPALVRTDAALLHGDLWSGNVIWSRHDSVMEGQTERGEDVVGVLIDPACQGGHAESDLAQLTVFAAPFVREIYAGYQEVSPLADGWQERVGLHRLHILIVHAALFGGSYGAQTITEARSYL